MKKLGLLFVCSLFFLTAWVKPKEVVPFLQPVMKELTQSTKVPVMLPTYWSKPTRKSKRYLTCFTHAYENGYHIDFLTMDKPYRPNDPALFHPRESWKMGDLYGNVGTVSSVDRPENFVFYKNKDGFELWIEPRVRSMVHGTDGKWTLLFDGDHGEEPYKQADELMKHMKTVHWMEDKDIIEGEIFVRGTRQAARVNFVWETSDGFVYSFFYKGSIKDAVKIVDSLQVMRDSPPAL